MTKDHIIEELCNKGIVVEISSSFYITEKYKELLLFDSKRELIVEAPSAQKIDHDSILDVKTNGKDWPVEILESKGRERAASLMDACKIPMSAKKGYRLRGLTKEAVNIVGNIVDNIDIDPTTFIDAVKIYYHYTEMPKAFKNLLLEGDILNLYEEHIEGKLITSLNDGPVENTREWS